MARVILGRGVRHPQPQGVEDPFRKTAATPRNSTNLDGSVHPLVPPTLARSNRRRRTTSDVHPVEILTQSAVRASLPSGARGSSFRTDTAHSDIASKPATPQAIRAPALQVTSVDDPFCMDISMGDNASPPATSSVARATKPASARGSSLFGELPQGDNSSPPATPRTVRGQHGRRRFTDSENAVTSGIKHQEVKAQQVSAPLAKTAEVVKTDPASSRRSYTNGEFTAPTVPTGNPTTRRGKRRSTLDPSRFRSAPISSFPRDDVADDDDVPRKSSQEIDGEFQELLKEQVVDKIELEDEWGPNTNRRTWEGIDVVDPFPKTKMLSKLPALSRAAFDESEGLVSGRSMERHAEDFALSHKCLDMLLAGTADQNTKSTPKIDEEETPQDSRIKRVQAKLHAIACVKVHLQARRMEHEDDH